MRGAGCCCCAAHGADTRLFIVNIRYCSQSSCFFAYARSSICCRPNHIAVCSLSSHFLRWPCAPPSCFKIPPSSLAPTTPNLLLPAAPRAPPLPVPNPVPEQAPIQSTPAAAPVKAPMGPKESKDQKAVVLKLITPRYVHYTISV